MTFVALKKRGRKSNAEKAILAQVKKDSAHPINVCALYICQHMSPHNIAYWNYEAKKKGVSLQKMIEKYIMHDFDIRDETFKFTENETKIS